MTNFYPLIEEAIDMQDLTLRKWVPTISILTWKNQVRPDLEVGA